LTDAIIHSPKSYKSNVMGPASLILSQPDPCQE
jgi:hypothetical protein